LGKFEFCSIYRGAHIIQARSILEMDLRDILATNLRRLRHEKGLAQDDLAYEAKVSRSYLSQLEKGAFYASLKILEKLAKALGVEPYELIVPPPRKRR
jgi:transcriptional regulator with XRE-family HTH domain